MAELIAQGQDRKEYWRRSLPLQEAIVLGRDEKVWSISWDSCISRRHAELYWRGDRLKVKRLSHARNPIFFRGDEVRTCELKPNESFVIGTTTFTYKEDQETVDSPDHPVFSARTVDAQELQQLPFRDAPGRLDVLNRIPIVIASASDEGELFTHLANMLLTGVPKASAVALVGLDKNAGDNSLATILHQEVRAHDQGTFKPSHRLINEALLDKTATVLHIWGGERPSKGLEYTLGGNFDWAFCVPVLNEGQEKWGIYVTGQFPVEGSQTLFVAMDSHLLADDLKFTELTARILRSVLTIKFLEHKESILGRFFSPEVLQLLASPDPEVALKSREKEVTVLFCDLRGFSRKVEEGEGDLFALLERVSKALRVMTQTILDQGGVISDYQGDAAMGFWGWPVSQPDKAPKACLAALSIRTFFESYSQIPNHPLSDFRVGIGLATGRAVAGTIGPENQVKIGVFGPVVNLASRLEGMTKTFGVPILMDKETALLLKQQVDWLSARWRRLAQVRPYGLEKATLIYELLPPAKEYAEMTDAYLSQYESAFDAFQAKEWRRAYHLLQELPETDLGKQFLMRYIEAHEYEPPPNWEGVIEMKAK